MLQTKPAVVNALDEQVLELSETAEISKEVEDARRNRIACIRNEKFESRKSNEVFVDREEYKQKWYCQSTRLVHLYGG